MSEENRTIIFLNHCKEVEERSLRLKEIESRNKLAEELRIKNEAESANRLKADIPPFIIKLLDSDSIAITQDGLWQLKPHVVEVDIFTAVAAADVSNPGTYIAEHFLKKDGSKYKATDVRDRLAKAKGRQ